METLIPRAIDPGDPESIGEVSLPIPLGDSKQVKYTYFRAMGFTKVEARELTPITDRMVQNWYNDDSHFKRLDNEDIRELRHTFAPEAISVEFTRNLALSLRVDRDTLEDAVKNGLARMSKNAFSYLKVIRSHYNPDQLVKMMRIASGNIDEAGDIDLTQIVNTVNLYVTPENKNELDEEAVQQLVGFQGS